LPPSPRASTAARATASRTASTSIPSTSSPRRSWAQARLQTSVTAELRSMAVPMPYRLFSQMKMTGSFQMAAMFIDSQKAPLFTAASPNRHTTTPSFFWYRKAKPTPTASGIWPPTMP
jgi:hypothetical protein